MDINQIITNMKTTELFQSILLFSLLLCGLAACSDSDEIRLSPFQETTVKGEASTLQIDLTRGDWRITSITTPWGDLMMDGNKLPQLEGTGSLHYKWWDLERDTDSHLILHFKDNFDLGESRSLIINLEMKTGFYKEQIIIHQEPCTNFYQLESIEYSVEEGDGVEEIEPQPWGVIIRDYTVGNGETQKPTSGLSIMPMCPTASIPRQNLPLNGRNPKRIYMWTCRKTYQTGKSFMKRTNGNTEVGTNKTNPN